VRGFGRWGSDLEGTGNPRLGGCLWGPSGRGAPDHSPRGVAVRLIVLIVGAGVLAGLALGGRPRWFPSVSLRWWGLAVVGIVLQLLPLRGDLAVLVLLISFGVLLVFALANVRVPGFVLISTGLVLNALVIGANRGMPVSVEALRGSGQLQTTGALARSDSAKHRLADDDTTLLALGDVLGIGGPIGSAVSVGDLCVDLGAAWFIAAAMRPPRRLAEREPPAPVGVAA
jgi:hypothetical protein